MAVIGSASLNITPSFDGMQGHLEKGVAPIMDRAGRSGGTKFAGGMRSSMSRHARSIVAPLVAGFAALKVKDFLGDSIAEARESQKVGALTASTIKATGRAAKVTAKQVGDLSGALSSKTGIDDEVIQSGANMLLTFKNIRNEAGKGNKVFNQSTAVLTDMSAALGSEPRQAAIQLGKALNDPVKGVTALSRVGVTFTDEQKEQIKTLVESGRTMDAQKVILRELRSEFGGAAEAQATMGDKAKVAWGNIKEGLGTALLPLVDDVEQAFLDKGVPAAEKFTAWFTKKGVPAIRNFADEAGPVVESVLPAIGDALTTTKDAAKFIAPKLKSVFDGFNSLPDWVKSTIVLGAGSAALAKKLGGGALASKAIGAVLPSKPIPVFVVNEGFGGAGKGGKLGTAGKVAAGTGAGAAGVLGGVALGLSAGAYGAHKFGESVERETGVSKFGTPNNPMEQQILTPDFKDANKRLDVTREKARNLRGEFVDLRELLANPYRAVVDDSDLRVALGLAKDYAAALREITTASAGFEARLKGDTFNFHGDIRADSGGSLMDQARSRAQAAVGGRRG